MYPFSFSSSLLLLPVRTQVFTKTGGYSWRADGHVIYPNLGNMIHEVHAYLSQVTAQSPRVRASVCVCVCVCVRARYGHCRVHAYMHVRACVCACTCACAYLSLRGVWWVLPCGARCASASKNGSIACQGAPPLVATNTHRKNRDWYCRRSALLHKAPPSGPMMTKVCRLPLAWSGMAKEQGGGPGGGNDADQTLLRYRGGLMGGRREFGGLCART